LREAARSARWQAFADAYDLRRLVLGLLVDHLLAHQARYQISAAEADALRQWRKTMEATARSKAAISDLRGGAEQSAVILTTERFVPSQGKLLGNAF
jgi:hypothetical protein